MSAAVQHFKKNHAAMQKKTVKSYIFSMLKGAEQIAAMQHFTYSTSAKWHIF